MRASIALLALVSMNAFANSGVGYFMVAMPIVALALIPAILLEAPVLGYLLKLPLRRAALLSLRANLVSTLVGLVAGLAVDLALSMSTGSSGFPFTRYAVAIMLIPWYLLSWWIEYGVIAKRLPEMPRQALRATGAANLLTYTLMIAVSLLSPFLPERDPSLTRARVSEALVTASGLRTEVTEFWVAHQRYPADFKELGSQLPESRRYRVTLERDGRIVVHVVAPDDARINGKQLEFAPQADPAALSNLKWTCRSPDIEQRYLPAGCRTPAP